MKNRRLVLTLVLLFSIWFTANAQSYLMSDEGVVNTCSGTLYDSGGANGNYGNNEDYVITICGNEEPDAVITIEFTDFHLESSGFDYLSIYDGPNLNSPVLVMQASDMSLNGAIIQSTGNCITVFMHTDESVQHGGFAAEINCISLTRDNCQDYTIDIVNTIPALTDPVEGLLNVCFGETVTFTAQGNFPNNNQTYLQTDANLHWYWSLISNGVELEFDGIGMNQFTYEFDESGGYFVEVYAVDINDCSAVFLDQLRVQVAIAPNIFNITQDQTTICPGEEVNFTGNVATNSWEMTIIDEQIVQECITDDQGVMQEFCWDVQAFEPGQTITDGDQFSYVCMNLEHSYIGDVNIYIRCPNGQEAEINYGGPGAGNPCNANYFGEPNQADNCVPGIGYDYCWLMGAGSSHTDWCNNNSSFVEVPSGDYTPTGDFDDLEGCPINGEWCVVIEDDWGVDDGTLFSVVLGFDESITPADLWAFDHTYTADNITWLGDGMHVNEGGTATANPTTPGLQEYTFSVTDDFGCTYERVRTVTVLDPSDPECCTEPIAYAGTDDEICSDTYQLSTELSLDVNTVEWSQVSGPGTSNFNGQQNSTNPTVTVDTYGVYEFEVLEENLSPACTDRDTVQITFYQTPNSSFTTSNINCYGESSTLVYNGTGSFTANYNWDFDGGDAVGNGQGPIDVSWTNAGIHSVSLTVEENGCVSNETSVNILTPELLTYTLTTENDPCFNTCEGLAELNVQGGTLPYTYSWGPNNLNLNLCAGNYSVTVNDNNGCEVSTNYTITEPAAIVILSSTTQDLSCFNANNGQIVVNAVGGAGSLNFAWSDGGSGSSRLNLPAGNYGLTITDENGCSIEEMYTLTQPNELLASISPDQAHCEGEPVTITSNAIGGTPPYTYYWDSGSGYMAAANVLTVTPSQTTTYVMYVEDANGCVSPAVSMTLTISPKMYMTLTTQDNRCFESCDGEARLSIEGGLPPLAYSWAASGSVNQNLCSGLYTVTVNDVIGCAVDTAFFIDQPAEIFGDVFTTDASCYGYNDGEATVEAVGGVPGYTYLWPDGTQSNNVTNLLAGIHQVTISDANDCRLSIDAVIDEPDILKVEIIGGERWICDSNTSQLSAQAIGGTPQYDFYWTGTDGSSYIVRDPIVSPDSTTTYTITAVDANGCTSSSPTVKVNVYPELKIEHIITSYDSICPGDSTLIEVDVSGGNGGSYSLSLQNGDVVLAPFYVSPSVTTNYIITLTDACGSPAVTDSIEIVVLPSPANSFISDKIEGCEPLKVKFNETSEADGQTYLWSFGDNGFAYDKNPTHIYENSGQYPVSLTVTSKYGCKTTRLINNLITVFPKPIADFYTDYSYVSVLDPEIQFFNVSADADSTYWMFGDGDSSHYENPVHSFNAIGEYEVRLIIESDKGCFDTVAKIITVRDEITFFAPNAFTPNGDGDNDFFMVYGHGINAEEFMLAVYDRWGEKVFETDIYDLDRPMESAWDGTFNVKQKNGDQLVPSGIYYWYCKYKDVSGIVHEKEGAVSLIR